jgi:predicted NBD/HSP70 family sugar kinase
MKEISIMQANGNDIFKSQLLTIGVDLGDRSSSYCILDEAGKILVEQKLPTTSVEMKQTFGRMVRRDVVEPNSTRQPAMGGTDE